MSKPTAFEMVSRLAVHPAHCGIDIVYLVDGEVNRVNADWLKDLAARVDRVLVLHETVIGRMCVTCSDDCPCPTRRILDGLDE